MPRKRRRKESGSKKVNPLMVVLVTCGVLLMVMVIGLVVVKAQVEAWLKGDEFRQLLVEKSAEVLRSEVELEEMKWEGSEAYTDRFSAEGYEDAPFSAMELEGIRAGFGGVMNRAFRVPEITVNRFNLLFSDKRLAGVSREEEEFKPEISGPALPDWLAGFVPNRIEVDEVRVASASVSVIDDANGNVPFQMKGVKADIYPDFETSLWEIKGQGGKLLVAGQPEIRLGDLAMRWRESEIFIDRASLGIFDDGHVAGAGEINFAEDGQFDLDLELSSINLDNLLEGELKDRFSGIVEGPVSITGQPGAFVYEGTARVLEAVVENIPVLTIISKYTRNPQFERLVLSQAETDFKHNGEMIELRNIALQADGLVRVEGMIDIQGELLAGQLSVGVAPGTLRWIPGAERQVFVENRDGWLWAPLNLGGTLSEPQEDLSGRLISAAGAAILKELPEGLLNEAQKFLDPSEGVVDPNSLIKQGKGLLDSLSPFLKGP